MAIDGVAGQSPGSRAAPRFGQSPNASMLLDRTTGGLRHATPESEAMASSDDEDHHSRNNLLANAIPPRGTVRRASWLSDGQGRLQRQASYTGSEPFSPASSHAGLGLHDSPSPWPTVTASRAHAGSASFPWGQGIWNAEAGPKAPPARLAEVRIPPIDSLSELPSTPVRHRDSHPDTAIPFAIPLQPTLKTYRSQSYSVGQQDHEQASPAASRPQPAPNASSRTRAASSLVGLQRRTSRPSMLGDFSPDTSVLEQLEEVEDDTTDDLRADSAATTQRFAQVPKRPIEQLSTTHAPIPPDAVASSNLLSPSQAGVLARLGLHPPSDNESVVEEAEDGLSVMDERQRAASFAMSNSTFRGPENPFDALRRAHWQSSLGFGGIPELPQSRRHSFAEMPAPHQSNNAYSNGWGLALSQRIPHHLRNPADGSPHTMSAEYAPGGGMQTNFRRPPSSSSSNGPFGSNLGNSRGPHGIASRPSILYLVTFKAARADFFYVHEDTGLDVKEGDLVIVEADRGTDLGTVARAHVDWAAARELRDHYQTEHVNWLMMFSRHGNNGAGAVGTPVTPAARSATGPAPASEMAGSEIKPKMIKRLAQAHEVHTLREKEGNEAKAKRMCQQKVAEHHLQMEILDAEFQVDWKKLTFYYYADAYVNFNSLVTDMFKIYKTRIWMSAINPASFASPNAGLATPTALPPNHGPHDRARGRHEASTPRGPEMIVNGRSGYNSPWSPMGSPSIASGPPTSAYAPVYNGAADAPGPASSFAVPPPHMAPYPSNAFANGRMSGAYHPHAMGLGPSPPGMGPSMGTNGDATTALRAPPTAFGDPLQAMQGLSLQ